MVFWAAALFFSVVDATGGGAASFTTSSTLTVGRLTRCCAGSGAV